MTDITDIDTELDQAFSEIVHNDPQIRNRDYDTVFGKPKIVHNTTVHATTIPVEKRAIKEKVMSEILRDADAAASGVDSDGYLRSLAVENGDLAGRLRHRATMMRLRANQFDQLADLYETKNLQHITKAVQLYEEFTTGIEKLLEQHNHINPTPENFENDNDPDAA